MSNDARERGVNEKDAALFRRIDEVLTGHELQRTTEYAMSVPDDSPAASPQLADRVEGIRAVIVLDTTGQTDMTTQIQACLDAGVSPPPGRYRITRSIEIRGFPRRLNLHGVVLVFDG